MQVTLSTDDFIVEPNEVQDYGSLMIRVNNRSVLDYETRTNITFQVQSNFVDAYKIKYIFSHRIAN